MLPLDQLGGEDGHVVPEVVKAEFAVGSIGYIGPVGRHPLGLVHEGVYNAHGKSEVSVYGPHPLGITLGQIIVHRDKVNPLPPQGIQGHGQGRHQGLPLAGLHLGDLALVEGHSAHELDVEVTKTQGSP